MPYPFHVIAVFFSQTYPDIYLLALFLKLRGHMTLNSRLGRESDIAR